MTTEPFELNRHLIDPKIIRAETRRRLDPDRIETISPKLREEYEADGWVLQTELKTRLRMRRAKTNDVRFEDRVWATMAKLDFTILNRDRKLFLPYGENDGERQQIDVLAVDDDVVLVIECKSTQSPKTYTFKPEIEKLSGQRAGMFKTLTTLFPGRKVRFIVASHNYETTAETDARFRNAKIIHMDDESVEYFLGLADHLGPAARYQLHGYLFANTKIPGIDNRVSAIQGVMGGHKYYSFAIEPERLLKMSYILHRNKANNEMMPTYQRLIKRSRLKAIGRFVDDNGFFPNSVIINIDTKRGGLQFDLADLQTGTSRIGRLHLPQTYRASYVIDGQHRLYGYANSDRASTDLIPVVAFENLPRPDQVRMFMEINENQKAVPKNLRNTLNADLLWDSPDLNARSKALNLRVAQRLGENRVSPLYGRVIVGEDSKSNVRCITIESISKGMARGNFLGTFTKYELKSAGTFHKGDNEATYKFLVPYLDRCFAYLRNNLESQWTLGNAAGGLIFINAGVEATLRIISDIVDHVEASNDFSIIDLSSDEVFGYTEPYLADVVEYVQTLTLDDVSALRGRYGSGGPVRLWRDFQQAILAVDGSFDPSGLAEYIQDQEEQFNAESYELVRDLEVEIRANIRRRLQDYFGSTWERKGIPVDVFKSSSGLAIEKNSKLEDGEEEVGHWDCMFVLDLQKILAHNHTTWQDIFEERFTLPGEGNMAWKKRSHWIGRLNTIRNKLAHPGGRAVSEDEYEFLIFVWSWWRDAAPNVDAS